MKLLDATSKVTDAFLPVGERDTIARDKVNHRHLNRLNAVFSIPSRQPLSGQRGNRQLQANDECKQGSQHRNSPSLPDELNCCWEYKSRVSYQVGSHIVAKVMRP